MGIYVFNWKKLRYYLTEDEKNRKSQNDFGKNILPAMLAAGERMCAYRFEGYWKDVGTIESLWEANMDLLDPNVPLDLSDTEWRIYSRNPGLPPHYIADGACVQNSMISEGGNIYGNVDFSVIFSGVTIEEGAEIRDSIIMPGACVRRGAKVQYAILAENVEVGENAIIGARPEDCPDLGDWGVAVVAEGVHVPPGQIIPAKAMIESDGKGND